MGEVQITGNGGDRARTVGGIVRSVVLEVQTLIRAELRLARHELMQEAREAAKAAPAFGVAGLAGLLAAICLVTCLVAALSIALPLWLAALLMAVMLGGAAGGVFLMGRFAMDKVDAVPQQTVETLKETITWVQTRSK
ncbi:MAG TPA: phage holin family protein [Bryobacteraceae bacterium]|nr:phage holin family protein [Bryobacteraceae bacterium]